MGTAPKTNPIIKEKLWVGRVGGAICRKQQLALNMIWQEKPEIRNVSLIDAQQTVETKPVPFASPASLADKYWCYD